LQFLPGGASNDDPVVSHAPAGSGVYQVWL
jgi:hypothetical protein